VISKYGQTVDRQWRGTRKGVDGGRGREEDLVFYEDAHDNTPYNVESGNPDIKILV
jgi:hypothetical protein